MTKVLCKGSVTLPPEAASPWRWHEWWAPILAAGKEAGADFSSGVQKVCVTTGKNGALNLRAQISGHRPTALRAVGLMLAQVPSLDLRDNMLTGAHARHGGSACTPWGERGPPLSLCMVLFCVVGVGVATRALSVAHARTFQSRTCDSDTAATTIAPCLCGRGRSQN